MKKIKKVISTLDCTSEHRERIERILHPAHVIWIESNDESIIEKELVSADMALLNGDFDEKYLRANNLKWIHCGHAGLNKVAKPEAIKDGLIITSSAGRSSPVLAEHAIFFMLLLSYRMDCFILAQQKHKWGIESQEDLRGLYGKTLGIIGMGHTGNELAKRAKALGMKVLAYSRSITQPENTDRYYSRDRGENIEAILKESDYLTLAIPLTDLTHHMISTEEFKLMRSSCCLINMARGAVVDETALIAALQSGEIAGAGLDAFEIEPLPADSKLWDMPNVFITPHCTPQVPDRMGRTIDIIEDNYRRFQNGEKMINHLKISDVYTKE